MDTVLQLVFDNEKAFEGQLTKEQTRNIVLCSKHATMNETVKKMCIIYQTYHMYNKLHNIIKQLVLRKVFADKPNTVLIQELEDQRDNILNAIRNTENDELWDCFERLIIAVYKEYTYVNNSKYYRYYRVEYFHEWHEYGIFMHMFGLRYHVHEPEHYIFSVGQHDYHFYEKCEKDGGYVLDRY